MRGTKQMNRLQMLPFGVPGSGIAGENAKESAVGIKVLLIKLVSPNRTPKIAPFLGPSIIAPRITGTWTMVALMIGSWIYPIGVKANNRMMAANRANSTKSRYFAV